MMRGDGTTLTLTTPDGHEIRPVLAGPADARRICVMIHGLTSDHSEAGLYDRQAELLTAAGIASVRFDFRGHGRSAMPSEKMTIAGEIVDLMTVLAAIDDYPEIVLLAHSFGGAVTGLLPPAVQKRFCRICLWSPVVSLWHTFIRPELPWQIEKFGVARFGRRLGGGRGVTIDGVWYAGLPLIYEGMRKKPEPGLRRLRQPLLILHGDADQMVSRARSMALAAAMPTARFVTVPGADHGFDAPIDRRAMVLTETTEFLTGEQAPDVIDVAATDFMPMTDSVVGAPASMVDVDDPAG